MLFGFMKACFSWLPVPLYLLVCTVFTIFAVLICIEVIKVIITVLNFIKDVFGGLLMKVVDFFA